VAAPVRIGTCSFADEALTTHWYPKGVSARKRLEYYAERFDTVEIDSTYYRLPERSTVERWAERTPDDFVFHIKAFGLLTRHPVKADTIPPDIREQMPVDDKGRIDRPPREARGAVFDLFVDALEPLRDAGKLGGILFQLPSYVVFRDWSIEYLEWAQDRLDGMEMLVEFRHRSWLDEDNRAETLRWLEARGLTHVIVDAPKTEAKNLVPTVPALTSPTLYVRLHGRNAGTWNKRGGSAAERFDYLYSDEELGEWIEPLRELAGEARNAYAFFNNNASSPGRGGGRVAQAPTNAAMLRQLLDNAGVPATGGLEPTAAAQKLF
jgi:uncharacterized protein YecE (DUF72 family)